MSCNNPMSRNKLQQNVTKGNTFPFFGGLSPPQPF